MENSIDLFIYFFFHFDSYKFVCSNVRLIIFNMNTEYNNSAKKKPQRAVRPFDVCRQRRKEWAEEICAQNLVFAYFLAFYLWRMKTKICYMYIPTSYQSYWSQKDSHRFNLIWRKIFSVFLPNVVVVHLFPYYFRLHFISLQFVRIPLFILVEKSRFTWIASSESKSTLAFVVPYIHFPYTLYIQLISFIQNPKSTHNSHMNMKNSRKYSIIGIGSKKDDKICDCIIGINSIWQSAPKFYSNHNRKKCEKRKTIIWNESHWVSNMTNMLKYWNLFR